MKARQWYSFKAKADDAVAELFIYDQIGRSYFNDDAVSAKQFVDDLAALPQSVSKIVVHVNSPGGDAFEAIAIANALREQASNGRTVETIVDGLAASAASIVMMAGSTVSMADNALFMVHNPYMLAMGNAADMRRSADVLDSVRNSIIATYRWKSSLSAEDIGALMDNETWMDADTAITNGFATNKVEGLRAAANINPDALAKLKIPEKFKARVDALLQKPTPEQPVPVAASADDVLAAVDVAGLSAAFARELVKAALPIDQVSERIATAKTERTQREARAADITALCATAKQPELAAGYINGAMSLADVKAHLVVITAKQDKVEIDAGLSPGHGTALKAKLNAADIYAARNRPTKHKE